MADDNKKSKARLIRELAELRQRLAGSESIPAADRRIQENRAPRAFIDQALHQSDNAIFTFDLEGRIQRINRKGSEITGYSLEELINSHLSVIFSLEALPQTSEQFTRVFVHGEVVSRLETAIIRKDGDTRAILFHATPFYEDGKITGVVGTAEDITDKKQAEERFRLLTETAADAILGMDAQGKINIWNKAATRMFGYESSEAIGCDLHALIMPDRYRKKAGKGLKAFARSGQGLLIGKVTVIEALRRDGTEFPVELSISAFRKDAAWHATAIIRDISERRQAEEALNKSQGELQTFFDLVPVMICIASTDGYFKQINKIWEQVLGFTTEELLGEPFASFMHPDDVTPTMQEVEKQLAGQATARFINRYRCKGGAYRWLEWVASPARENGLLFASAMDITGRKQAAQELKESHDRLRTGLVATVQVIGRAVEARDPYTAGHQLRVSRLSRAIAQAMGMDNEQIEGIRLGAMVHDIGKIQVPSEILSRPGVLNNNEFMLIQEHPVSGYNILKDVDFPWPVANIAYQHHERLDGSGYPQGLKGDEICLEARIVAVADVVEAMYSHRPYRPGLGIDAALAEIEAHKGTHYEPAVVDACLKLFRETAFSFEDESST